MAHKYKEIAEERGALLGGNGVNDEGGGGEFGSVGDVKPVFVKSKGLTSAEADALRLQYGRNELEEKKTPKWYIFLSQLWQPMVSYFNCLVHNETFGIKINKSSPFHVFLP